MEKFDSLPNLFEQKDGTTYFDPFENISLLSPDYELGNDVFRTNPLKKIAGYNSKEFRSLEDTYELIHPDDVEFVFNFSKRTIQFVNNHVENTFESKTEVIFRAKGKGGKMYYLHRTCIPNGANGKQLTHNITFLNDVTWMHPKYSRSWNLECDHSELFSIDNSEISNFNKQFGPREIQILKLLARGFQSRDIANLLRISRHTVDTHRRNMLRKLDAANTPQLIDLARDMKLF
jgi:DNA-binding CsgD family transcriptional regulator